jgi:endogenous inhibitor of DNA gyrase (YacG/DUF329 family)
MSTTGASPQRSYQAPCPGCGAPVQFVCAQSTHAVCAYCQSTVVRQGDKLARLGKMAELFNDHSLLQIGVTGQYQQQNFTLLGRLQYQYSEGTWTEWHALLQNGSSAFLSEDHGAYVMTRPLTMGRDIPPADRLRLGAKTAINGKRFTVTSNQQVALLAAQGELPYMPPLGTPHAMVELRSDDGEVLSIDYGTAAPRLCLGKAVSLEALSLQGLRDDATQHEKGRQFDCPHCGAPVTMQLESSKSLTCAACNSLIDLTQGIGKELRHALQDEPVKPLIALGSTATYLGASWQVVGFQHRMGVDASDPDEQFGWEEYLLYNTKRGFTFLVDSVDGWSMVKPATGAPSLSPAKQTATYLGMTYQRIARYTAETNYVAGEFYWQVQRGQKTENTDYANGKNLLNREQSRQEITWSVGSKLESDKVAKMFKMEGSKELLQRADASPFTASSTSWQSTLIMIVVFLLFWSWLSAEECDPKVENCANARTSGATYGGYSSGGWHK